MPVVAATTPLLRPLLCFKHEVRGASGRGGEAKEGEGVSGRGGIKRKALSGTQVFQRIFTGTAILRFADVIVRLERRKRREEFQRKGRTTCTFTGNKK
jgi:hypothetical protein